jgi:aminopeptidase N
MKLLFSQLLFGILALSTTAQIPKIEPGISHELAAWRAAHYSDIRYKLNLTIEKMSPVLKGTIEIHVNLTQPKSGPTRPPSGATQPGSEPPAVAGGLNFTPPIILDWRKIAGHEKDSTITNVSINGRNSQPRRINQFVFHAEGEDPNYIDDQGHLFFNDGVIPGENVMKLDFTSPILTSGSAIARYIDKEDDSEYIYSLLSPLNASTAFPMFNQPDLETKFTLNLLTPDDWRVISNTAHKEQPIGAPPTFTKLPSGVRNYEFAETQPICTYGFAFAVGPWGQFTDMEKEYGRISKKDFPVDTHIYVRKSQYVKAGNHIAKLFKTARESNKYFDYKSTWSKHDLVLIPDLPSEMIQARGITFVRESSIISEK